MFSDAAVTGDIVMRTQKWRRNVRKGLALPFRLFQHEYSFQSQLKMIVKSKSLHFLSIHYSNANAIMVKC